MSLNTYSDLLTLWGVGGLVWYVLYDIISDIFTYFQAHQSGTYSATALTFFMRLWDWFPLVLVVGGLIMVTVQSQREGQGGGYAPR